MRHREWQNHVRQNHEDGQSQKNNSFTLEQTEATEERRKGRQRAGRMSAEVNRRDARGRRERKARGDMRRCEGETSPQRSHRPQSGELNNKAAKTRRIRGIRIGAES